MTGMEIFWIVVAILVLILLFFGWKVMFKILDVICDIFN